MFISSIGKQAGLPKGGVVSEPLAFYKFEDSDIEGVTYDEHNIKVNTVELLIKAGAEAVLLHKNDAIALAEHFGLCASNRTTASNVVESNEHKPSALPLGDAGKLVEALEGLLREAVILSREYLKAFDNYGPDDTIQGWDKARWLRAADAADFARETLSTHLAGTSKGDGE
jgi:hypothetical protein